jgi:hypothetical protein
MECTNLKFLITCNHKPMTTQERIEKAEKELSALKALALKEKEEKEFNVGDWVAYMESGWQEVMKSKYNVVDNVYKIKELNDGYIYVEGYGERSNAERTNFRKATEEEIKTHLISEAEKKGFVKGASVVSIALGGSASIIGNVFLYRDIAKFFPNARTSYYGEDKKDAICVNYSCHRGWDFLDKVKLLPSAPQIEINGYKAEFKTWGISFNNGCAKISKEVFIQLAKSCNGAVNDDNRTLESVKIGKGEFSRDQIKEIANHFTK